MYCKRAEFCVCLSQVVILEHKSIICAGYSAVMHIHCVAEEVTVQVCMSLLHFKFPLLDSLKVVYLI